MAVKGRDPLSSAPPPAASASSDSDSSSASDEDEDHHLSTDENDHPTPSVQKLLTPNSKSKSKPKPKPKPISKSTSKRPSQIEDDNNNSNKPSSKKPKKDKPVVPTTPTTPTPEKHPLFQRLWSEEDEIVILKGMIDFKAKKGTEPWSDLDGFLDFIKKSLHVADVTKVQISSKIRRLRGRFATAKLRKKLSNPHEIKAFELSKRIWGDNDEDVVGNAKELSNAKGKEKVKGNGDANGVVTLGNEREEKEEEDGGNLVISSGGGGGGGGGEMETEMFGGGAKGFGFYDEGMINKGLRRLKGGEREELEDKWRELHVMEMEVALRRIDLIRQTIRKSLDAIKSSSSAK